jgi:hypothetical protein
MQIYSQEQDLKDKILANLTASVCLPINITEDKSDLLINSLEKLKKQEDKANIGKVLAQVVNDSHPDLMYGSAILMSTLMNRNDDLFLAKPTWDARGTIVNNPYNDDHIETNIIGHIIGYRLLDSNSSIIDEDAYTDGTYPEYFDVEVDFVMYKSIFPEIASEILEKAPKNQKFVSVEAKLENFDYALVDVNNDVKIIARNEKTAFLTKHLRVYGGSGKYNNYKVGRALSKFRFTGMGSVDVPANPGSEYTKLNKIEVSQANFEDSTDRKVYSHIIKGTVMKIETLEQANSVIDSLKSEIEGLKASAAQEESNKKIETLTASNSDLTSRLTASETKTQIAEQKISELQTQLAASEEKVKTIEASLAQKDEAIKAFEKEKKDAARLEKIVSLKIELNDEKKTKLLAMSDEAFASVLEFATSVAPSGQVTKEESTEEATKVLENTSASDNIASPENTAGENANKGAELETVAAKLVETIRANRNQKINLPKRKK